MQKSMSLRYEPASEPLHISVKSVDPSGAALDSTFLAAKLGCFGSSSSSLLLSSPELSDTKVYDP